MTDVLLRHADIIRTISPNEKMSPRRKGHDLVVGKSALDCISVSVQSYCLGHLQRPRRERAALASSRPS